MMQRRILTLASTLVAASMLAACSGGGGGGAALSPVPQPSNNPAPGNNGLLSDSIAAISSVSAPIQGKDPDELPAPVGGGSGKCTQEPAATGQHASHAQMSAKRLITSSTL